MAGGLTSKSRILVVDDKPDVRMLLSTRLSFESDLEVVGEAGDGAEAITKVRELSPDAVVLDLDMPVMTGADAIPLLRAIKPDLRIVVHSGSEGVGQLDGASAPDATVLKGTELRVLVRELRRLLVADAEDILDVRLPPIDLDDAVSAFDSWAGMNMRIREAFQDDEKLTGEQLAGATKADLLALAGLFITLSEPLMVAAQGRRKDVALAFKIRRGQAVGARRALDAIHTEGIKRFHSAWDYDSREEAFGPLMQLRTHLLDNLPAG